jgi:hypothetical protein
MNTNPSGFIAHARAKSSRAIAITDLVIPHEGQGQ